jgi:nicotinamidase-related amidase
MKNLIFAFTSVLILFVIFAAYQLSKFFSVSSGSKISQYQNPKTAILVMDMQIEFADSARKIIETVNKTVDYFSAKNDTLVYIKTQYGKSDYLLNFIRKNAAIEGATGVNFLPDLKVASQNIFTKDRMDAFSNRELDDFLVKNQIGHIFVAGLDGCYCLDKTVRAALRRGYKVTLITDAAVSKKDAEFGAVKESLNQQGVELISSAELIK